MWTLFQLLHTLLQTARVSAGGHGLMKATRLSPHSSTAAGNSVHVNHTQNSDEASWCISRAAHCRFKKRRRRDRFPLPQTSQTLSISRCLAEGRLITQTSAASLQTGAPTRAPSGQIFRSDSGTMLRTSTPPRGRIPVPRTRISRQASPLNVQQIWGLIVARTCGDTSEKDRTWIE